MSKKRSNLQIAQEQAELTIKKTNDKIEELGKYTSNLYTALTDIQELFDKIRNVPSEKHLDYRKLKVVRSNWKQQVEKIESDYKNAVVKNAGKGVAGVSAGVAVAALGPTTAMGIATTFGVASTGTAISALSGAAATNAALAWLGGGALAAGGGGITAGNALLALAGPVGWAIAGIALLGSGLLFWKTKSDQNRLEDIFTLISKRDIKSYELAIVELNERISRIKDEGAKLNDAIEKIESFGVDYNQMTEVQQYELGAYVNLMSASTQLLVNPILGLQPKYNEEDFSKFISEGNGKTNEVLCSSHKDLIIALSNLLYKIKLDDKDKKLLWKSFKKNKKFLSSMNISKKEFDDIILDIVCEALYFKY
ncbi:hypothetical protein BSK66_10070 [Paenibacillus odorifer]|uniref:Uncharacterized protein n=1 Tax=Paenibacillus odorifer TaxID=189426 RepID=A0A1R0XDT4_9BACL|nr:MULTISPECIES: hypothetical protein [Paenibacillus]ETT45432.1 hypothetical protein C171_32086 [Paenibacillus sp. FSL H8-237]OMD33207.1 hypothetical protein BJP51_12655 [Paenibacillus odorifer]OME59686.1 hypothetical protein BSK66_10070 [Paenibacillus odorifer]